MNSGRIQAGVMLHLMAKIRRCPAVHSGSRDQIFTKTGSRHLSEAENTFVSLISLYYSSPAAQFFLENDVGRYFICLSLAIKIIS